MQNNKNINSAFQKLSKIMLLIMITFSILFTNVQKADAFVASVTFETGSFAANLGMLAESLGQWFKENYEKLAFQSSKQYAISQVEKSMTNWINGGFEGQPLFLQNPESFFKNIAIDQLSIVKKSAIGDLQDASNILTSELRAANKDITKSLIDEVVNKKANFQDSLLPTYNTDICKKLTADIKMYTEMGSSTDISAEEKKGWKDNADISKEKYKENCGANTKEKKADQVANNKDCIASFACSGWGGLLAVTQNPAQNTDAGRRAALEANFKENQAAAEKKANDQLDRGSGYMDKTQCLRHEKVEGREICVSSESKTTGQVALSATEALIKRPLDQLSNSSDWTSLINNLSSAAMVKIMDMGIESASKAVTEASNEADKNINTLTKDLEIKVKPDGTMASQPKTPGSSSFSDIDYSNADLTEEQRAKILELLKPVVINALEANKKEIEALDKLIAVYRNVFDAYAQVASCYDGKKINIPQNIKNRAAEVNSILLSLVDVRNTAVKTDIDITAKYNGLITTKSSKDFNAGIKVVQSAISDGKLLKQGKYQGQEHSTIPTLNKEIEKVTVGPNSDLAVCQGSNNAN